MTITDYLVLVGLLLVLMNLHAIKGLLVSVDDRLYRMNNRLEQIYYKDTAVHRDDE